MNENEPISDSVLEEIKKHFSFLFDRGYVIHSAYTINKDYGVWEVVLKHQDFSVRLFAEPGNLDLFFGASSKSLIEIGSLIYFLSGEKDLVESPGDMKKKAILLQKHIDEFELCFGIDFAKYEEGLKFAEKRYYAQVSPEAVDGEDVAFPAPRQRSTRTLVFLAIVLFPVFWLFFAIIIGLGLQGQSLGEENFSFYSIITWGISFLLALWIAVAIIRSNKPNRGLGENNPRMAVKNDDLATLSKIRGQSEEYIKKHFAFLFDRGYEIVSTRYYSGNYGGNWEVLFESPDFSLKIANNEGERSYSFGSPSETFMSVEALIYLLSGRKGVIYASEANIANQLERYIDEIENRFRVDRSGLEKEVESAQKKLDELAGKSSKSLSLLISGIPYIILVLVFFNIFNELLFGWLLSGWLVGLGYSSSSWLISGVSLILAAATTYTIHKAINRPY